jgi:indoleamine 2,3-dioxygenase
MDLMSSTYDEFIIPMFKDSDDGVTLDSPYGKYKDQTESMMALVLEQRRKLAKEVERWCAERGV